MDRYYCTLCELIDDLGLSGVKREAMFMKHIASASQFIEREIGQFFPTVETRSYSVDRDTSEILVHPLLEVSQVVNNGTALSASDYTLYPPARCWQNGPYSSIQKKSGLSTLDYGVEITGKWGLYLLEEPSGVQVDLSSASTTMLVGDGSLISPGMVLRIEDEYLLVSGTGASLNIGVVLSATIDDSVTEITVSNGALFYVGEVVRIGFEAMRIVDIQSNTLYVERGWHETKRVGHTAGVSVLVHRYYNVRRGINGTVAAAHTSANVYRCLPPADINYLCRQIAALMFKKAQTGYMGRSGNDDLGTGFWINEFPKNQIEAIRQNYFWGGR